MYHRIPEKAGPTSHEEKAPCRLCVELGERRRKEEFCGFAVVQSTLAEDYKTTSKKKKICSFF
jgi:hypothetical protein